MEAVTAFTTVPAQSMSLNASIHTWLLSTIKKIDEDINIRRLTLGYPSNLYNIVMDTADLVLTPRPWWRIVRESFPEFEVFHGGADSQGSMEIILERVLPSEESHLRFIAG
jgi:hypothetical protein